MLCSDLGSRIDNLWVDTQMKYRIRTYLCLKCQNSSVPLKNEENFCIPQNYPQKGHQTEHSHSHYSESDSAYIVGLKNIEKGFVEGSEIFPIYFSIVVIGLCTDCSINWNIGMVFVIFVRLVNLSFLLNCSIMNIYINNIEYVPFFCQLLALKEV